MNNNILNIETLCALLENKNGSSYLSSVLRPKLKNYKLAGREETLSCLITLFPKVF